MRKLLAALLAIPFSYSVANAQDAQAGKALWEGAATQCRNCHGDKGEGAFGPDLAGRKLTTAQFTHAVRRPWGVMPAFIDKQVSDAEIGNLVAYFSGLPTVEQPGKWRFPVPPNAPRGQMVALTSGCAQCHGPILAGPRSAIGGVDMDFDWFKSLVYDHTTALPLLEAWLEEKPRPRMRMGNFSPNRMWESQLREIYDWARDLGPRARLEARLGKGTSAGNGVTYPLTIENGGIKGRGVTAEDLTVRLIVPKDAEVIATTGDGYQGVRPDEQAKANVATWKLPRLAPKDHASIGITLSKAATAADNLSGEVRWSKPTVKTGAFDRQAINPAPL